MPYGLAKLSACVTHLREGPVAAAVGGARAAAGAQPLRVVWALRRGLRRGGHALGVAPRPALAAAAGVHEAQGPPRGVPLVLLLLRVLLLIMMLLLVQRVFLLPVGRACRSSLLVQQLVIPAHRLILDDSRF